MRKFYLFFAIFLAAVAVTAFAFDPSELEKITFHNQTGRNIQNIFLSPSDSGDWGPELIGAEYHLGDGKALGYYVHYPGSSFKFDIMAIDDQGSSFELYEYQLTAGKDTDISFTRKNLINSAPKLSYAKLTVTNETDYDMYYLFISPSDSDAWGVDLLDEDEILSSGESYAIVIPIAQAKVKYNVMGVDEDNDEYTFDITIDPKKNTDFNVSIDPGDYDGGN
jgi:hypothetical protein